MERRKQEIEMLREQFPALTHGEGLDWVMIPAFRLPAGWNREHTRILIIIPPGYPQTPPDNFYVDIGLRTAGGNQPNGYSEPASQVGESWGQFSWHADVPTWRPAPEPRDGHNLCAFLCMIGARLAEVG
jgi:hypothetical protein